MSTDWPSLFVGGHLTSRPNRAFGHFHSSVHLVNSRTNPGPEELRISAKLDTTATPKRLVLKSSIVEDGAFAVHQFQMLLLVIPVHLSS